MQQGSPFRSRGSSQYFGVTTTLWPGIEGFELSWNRGLWPQRHCDHPGGGGLTDRGSCPVTQWQGPRSAFLASSQVTLMWWSQDHHSRTPDLGWLLRLHKERGPLQMSTFLCSLRSSAGIRVGQKSPTDTQGYASELHRASLALEFLSIAALNPSAGLIIVFTMLTF